jgi:hypothetical protein
MMFNTLIYIYMLITQYLEYEMRQLGIKLNAKIMEDIEQWFADVVEELELHKDIDLSVAGEITIGTSSPLPIPILAKFLAKLTSQIKGGSKDKTTIRRKVEKDLSRLAASLNLLLEDAEEKLIKKYPKLQGILIVFDNLDRCPPHVADKLFFDYATQLQTIDCTIVYTIPIASLYSPQGIAKTFTTPYTVSMVNIYEFEDKPDLLSHSTQGLNSLVQLLDKRLDTNLIFETPDVLLDIVRASGGHVRDLMKMVKQACLTAIGRKHSQVQTADARYAINQIQFSLEREIPDTHYPVIAEAYLTKRTPSNALGQDCLFYTYVLEYNGDRRWNYPHPTVIKINAFQKALAKLQQQP